MMVKFVYFSAAKRNSSGKTADSCGVKKFYLITSLGKLIPGGKSGCSRADYSDFDIISSSPY